MTTYKGVVKTIADAATQEHTNASGRGEGSLLHVTQDIYTAATLVQGSIVEIGSKLPLNAWVYETILGYAALGASTSLSLGDIEDPDRYITNTVTTSAGLVRTNAASGMNYQIDETNGTDAANTDRQIQLIVVDTGSATGLIKATIFWAK